MQVFDIVIWLWLPEPLNHYLKAKVSQKIPNVREMWNVFLKAERSVHTYDNVNMSLH